MKKLLLISIALIGLSCTPDELYECDVRIGIIDNYTKEYIPASIDTYNMLYDLYMELDNGCNDATIDYGNHTIIYIAL